MHLCCLASLERGLLRGIKKLLENLFLRFLEGVLGAKGCKTFCTIFFANLFLTAFLFLHFLPPYFIRFFYTLFYACTNPKILAKPQKHRQYRHKILTQTFAKQNLNPHKFPKKNGIIAQLLVRSDNDSRRIRRASKCRC